jgi:hypothetical protein
LKYNKQQMKSVDNIFITVVFGSLSE